VWPDRQCWAIRSSLKSCFMIISSVPDKKLEMFGRTRFDGGYEAPTTLVL
jgi:hypothetical protein